MDPFPHKSRNQLMSKKKQDLKQKILDQFKRLQRQAQCLTNLYEAESQSEQNCQCVPGTLSYILNQKMLWTAAQCLQLLNQNNFIEFWQGLKQIKMHIQLFRIYKKDPFFSKEFILRVHQIFKAKYRVESNSIEKGLACSSLQFQEQVKALFDRNQRQNIKAYFALHVLVLKDSLSEIHRSFISSIFIN